MTSEPLLTWLRTRSPAPPPRLLARVTALAARAPAGASHTDVLLDAAESVMRDLLHDGCLTRDSAGELLAVDALVTYAFEAAADEPDRLEAMTRGALARIAALAGPYET